MDKYLFTLVKINPTEWNSSDLCIWCQCKNKKNSAHIFSKHLFRSNKSKNVLKKSVCEKCNSFFGNKIEDWFLKYSPIATWSQTVIKQSKDTIKTYKYVPNFIWSEDIDEWLVVNHGDNTIDTFPDQLILSSDNSLLLFHFRGTNKVSESDLLLIEKHFVDSITNQKYELYINSSLPEAFSPRLFKYKEKIILIAQDHNIKEHLIAKCLNQTNNQNNVSITYADIQFPTKMVIHHKWSINKYFKLCGKIGFEFLALFKGSEFCLAEQFKGFIETLFESIDDEITVPYYDGKGYKVNQFSPTGWVGLFNMRTKVKGFPVLHTFSPNCHKVFIYEVDGCLLLTVQLFNIETCQIVIAEDIEMKEIFYVEYNYINDEFNLYYSHKNPTVLSSDKYEKLIDNVESDSNTILGFFQDNIPNRIFNKV